MVSAHADIVARQQLPGIAGRPGTMFALLDAANLPGLHAQIQTLGAAALCLFKGASAKTLRDVAPYLLRLDGDSAYSYTGVNARVVKDVGLVADPGLARVLSAEAQRKVDAQEAKAAAEKAAKEKLAAERAAKRSGAKPAGAKSPP